MGTQEAIEHQKTFSLPAEDCEMRNALAKGNEMNKYYEKGLQSKIEKQLQEKEKDIPAMNLNRAEMYDANIKAMKNSVGQPEPGMLKRFCGSACDAVSNVAATCAG